MMDAVITGISVVTILLGCWLLGFDVGKRVGFRRAAEIYELRNPE